MDDLGFSLEEIEAINSGTRTTEPEEAFHCSIPPPDDLSTYPLAVQKDYFSLCSSEIERRKQFFLNSQAFNRSSTDSKSGVSKIDRIQKCIKKLKSISAENGDETLREIEELNLGKYLSEVAQALAENKMHVKDLSVLVAVCSVLHQKDMRFSKLLQKALRKAHKEGDYSRKKAALRLIVELMAYGV